MTDTIEPSLEQIEQLTGRKIKVLASVEDIEARRKLTGRRL